MAVEIQPNSGNRADFPRELFRGPVEVKNRLGSMCGEGVVMQHLGATDRVTVSVRFKKMDLASAINDPPGKTVIRFRGARPKFPIIRTSLNGAIKGDVHAEYVPASGRLGLYRDARIRIGRVRIHIANLPHFITSNESKTAQRTRIDGAKKELGEVELVTDEWRIEIHDLPNTSENLKCLKNHGGYALTHIGEVSRLDGKTYSLSSVQHIISDLHLFLSFARGGWISIFDVVGFNKAGQVACQDWGTRISTPWEGRLSWFDEHHGSTLEALFPGFVSLLGDTRLGDAASSALYWYLRSNRAGAGAGTDGSLILSQAALELLAHAIPFAPETRPSKSTTTNKIVRASEQLGIPVAIPRTLSNLKRGERSDLWRNGPDAIVKLRNEFIHPVNRLGADRRKYAFEAWQLAQWYVEMFILRLTGYRDVYSNRLYRGYVGQVVRVPWSQT